VCCVLAPQIYYQLSRIRQARRIRDVVLVRLEQLAPFPHDLISRVRPACRVCRTLPVCSSVQPCSVLGIPPVTEAVCRMPTSDL
jgi:2-oxoglutarate dehydrogenase C-terminal